MTLLFAIFYSLFAFSARSDALTLPRSHVLADITVPWSTTSAWMFGLLGFMLFLSTALSIANSGRKLFGRRPPFDEELKTMDKSLRSEMSSGDNRVQANVNLLRADMERQFDELRQERKEAHASLTELFIRQVDHLGQKIDEAKADQVTLADRRQEKISDRLADLTAQLAALNERTRPR